MFEIYAEIHDFYLTLQIESYGSQSGKCSQKITVVDAGQL